MFGNIKSNLGNLKISIWFMTQFSYVLHSEEYMKLFYTESDH